MTLRATFIGCSLLAMGCIPASRAVILRSDARLQGGAETRAQVDVPGMWLQIGSGPHYPTIIGIESDTAQHAEPLTPAAHAQVIGPDNFSTVQLTLAPVTVDAARCPELANRAAQDAAKRIDWVTVLGNEHILLGSQWRRPVSTDTKFTPGPSPDTVDYELYVPGNVPGPSERVVIGRVVCRDGGLVTVACSTGHLKTDVLALCHDVVASLKIDHGPWLTPGNQSPPVEPPPEESLPPEGGVPTAIPDQAN